MVRERGSEVGRAARGVLMMLVRSVVVVVAVEFGALAVVGSGLAGWMLVRLARTLGPAVQAKWMIVSWYIGREGSLVWSVVCSVFVACV